MWVPAVKTLIIIKEMTRSFIGKAVNQHQANLLKGYLPALIIDDF